jgi:hypothetical protein
VARFQIEFTNGERTVVTADFVATEDGDLSLYDEGDAGKDDFVYIAAAGQWRACRFLPEVG